MKFIFSVNLVEHKPTLCPMYGHRTLLLVLLLVVVVVVVVVVFIVPQIMKPTFI